MKRKVLIVEDDKDIGLLEKMMVESEGYETSWIQDANQITEQTDKINPDVIVMDVMLPRKDGFTAVTEMQKNNRIKDIPILFVSVLAESLIPQKPNKSSKVHFLQKPFEIHDFIREVNLLAG